MKALITSLTLAIAITTGFGGLAEAGSCNRPQSPGHGSHQRHYEHVAYHVEYFACSCGKWRCYGVYDHQCAATTAAKKLARQGYKARIVLEVE